MIEVEKIISAITRELASGMTFHPSEVGLTSYLLGSESAEEDEDVGKVGIDTMVEHLHPQFIEPCHPINRKVVAIDSTSFGLGLIPDGLVGAVRLSVIIKETGKTNHGLERYGPYIVPVTNQNKEALYCNLYRTVYDKDPKGIHAPDYVKTFDRIRDLLEKYVQLEVVKNFKESLILLDGSLIGRTVALPELFTKRVLDCAAGNSNCIVAISKSTGLTLESSQKSILSLLDGVLGPCYIPGVKDHIGQDRDRYFGDIYVAKLTPLGEPFRIDIPGNAPIEHSQILNELAGLAGEYGYPEELKLAHMACVFSSLEILELQAVAVATHGLVMREELRRKLFPL
jgi:hypothetical protein